jgi:hypothetical protein
VVGLTDLERAGQWLTEVRSVRTVDDVRRPVGAEPGDRRGEPEQRAPGERDVVGVQGDLIACSQPRAELQQRSGAQLPISRGTGSEPCTAT